MFGTSGIRGPVGTTVTAETALSVGRALGTDGAETVVVGRDARASGEFLESALVAGLRECGADVIRIGLAGTPTIARAVGHRDADAGVSITASHNPPQDNGLKLWNPSGQAFDTEQRARLTDLVEAEAYELEAWDQLGEETSWAGADDHHRQTLVAGHEALDELSVVVDIGNGVGQVTADVLVELGADVTTLNAQPDGRFPGRPSEPTAETCRDLRAHVAATDADLGVAHDGDADRMMAVDDTGSFVSGDVLLALFARRAIAEGDGTTIAAPLNTSLAVDDALDPLGGTVARTRVGDVFVAERAAEGDVVFGGEPSGAWIWPAETRCPDGPLAATKLASMVRDEGSLSTLREEIETYPLERESIDVPDARKADLMEAVRTRITDEYENVTTLDGVRVETEEGWFLIRASGTQPLIRLTAEARTPEQTAALLDTARDAVQRELNEEE